jgi:sugar phosphate permease
MCCLFADETALAISPCNFLHKLYAPSCCVRVQQQNISTNLGGFLSPLIVGYLAKHFGWQWGLMAPGMFGLAAGTLLLFALADKPEDTGVRFSH